MVLVYALHDVAKSRIQRKSAISWILFRSQSFHDYPKVVYALTLRFSKYKILLNLIEMMIEIKIQSTIFLEIASDHLL